MPRHNESAELEEAREQVGRNIKARRYALPDRVSQEELGERAGMDRSWISKLENGKAAPGLDTLLVLARVLDCSPADLLEGL